MKKIQRLKVRTIITGLIVVVLGILLTGTIGSSRAYAVDSNDNYRLFNKTIGSCPRSGQPVRDECILKVAKQYVDRYCTGKPDANACLEDWRNGYLVWFAAQPNQDELKNQIGMTAVDTSNPECSAANANTLPKCTRPYNSATCNETPRLSFCQLPALSTDPGDSTATTENVGTIAVDLKTQTSGHPCGGPSDDPIDPVIDLGCKGLGNPILDIVFAIMRFLSLGAGLVMIASTIGAGIQYTASKGDPQGTGAAIKRIASSVSALALFLFAYAILNWIIPGGVLK